MENELKAHREHLEEKVKERTAELIQEKMMAETANRAKSVFIGSMSHELRTPLNAILGFSQLLIEDPLLSSQHNEKLKSINKNAEQLLKLLNKIIDISKIESDITTTTLSTFHLKPLLDNIENIFRHKALSKRLEFSLEQSQKIPEFIETDKDKLQQILFNLLDNAVKFTKKGTIQLRISVSRLEQDKVTLFFVVEDSGSGIAGDEIDKIFEPFYRPEKNKNLGGTGLGLALSKEFCTLLGGTILVQSEIKKGSLFTASIVVNEKYKLSIIEQCDEQETKKNADYHLPLTADDLQTVPYKLVVEIISSIKKLDQEMLLESVGKITEISADFCQQLKVMARGYQYDKLISLFEERRGNHE